MHSTPEKHDEEDKANLTQFTTVEQLHDTNLFAKSKVNIEDKTKQIHASDFAPQKQDSQQIPDADKAALQRLSLHTSDSSKLQGSLGHPKTISDKENATTNTDVAVELRSVNPLEGKGSNDRKATSALEHSSMALHNLTQKYDVRSGREMHSRTSVSQESLSDENIRQTSSESLPFFSKPQTHKRQGTSQGPSSKRRRSRDSITSQASILESPVVPSHHKDDLHWVSIKVMSEASKVDKETLYLIEFSNGRRIVTNIDQVINLVTAQSEYNRSSPEVIEKRYLKTAFSDPAGLVLRDPATSSNDKKRTIFPLGLQPSHGYDLPLPAPRLATSGEETESREEHQFGSSPSSTVPSTSPRSEIGFSSRSPAPLSSPQIERFSGQRGSNISEAKIPSTSSSGSGGTDFDQIVSQSNPTLSSIDFKGVRPGGKSSSYHGVSWHTQRKRWRAYVYLSPGKQKYLGTYEDERDAAMAYNNAVIANDLRSPLNVVNYHEKKATPTPDISGGVVARTSENPVSRRDPAFQFPGLDLQSTIKKPPAPSLQTSISRGSFPFHRLSGEPDQARLLRLIQEQQHAHTFTTPFHQTSISSSSPSSSVARSSMKVGSGTEKRNERYNLDDRMTLKPLFHVPSQMDSGSVVQGRGSPIGRTDTTSSKPVDVTSSSSVQRISQSFGSQFDRRGSSYHNSSASTSPSSPTLSTSAGSTQHPLDAMNQFGESTSQSLQRGEQEQQAPFLPQNFVPAPSLLQQLASTGINFNLYRLLQTSPQESTSTGQHQMSQQHQIQRYGIFSQDTVNSEKKENSSKVQHRSSKRGGSSK